MRRIIINRAAHDFRSIPLDQYGPFEQGDEIVIQTIPSEPTRKEPKSKPRKDWLQRQK